MSFWYHTPRGAGELAQTEKGDWEQVRADLKQKFGWDTREVLDGSFGKKLNAEETAFLCSLLMSEKPPLVAVQVLKLLRHADRLGAEFFFDRPTFVRAYRFELAELMAAHPHSDMKPVLMDYFSFPQEWQLKEPFLKPAQLILDERELLQCCHIMLNTLGSDLMDIVEQIGGASIHRRLLTYSSDVGSSVWRQLRFDSLRRLQECGAVDEWGLISTMLSRERQSWRDLSRTLRSIESRSKLVHAEMPDDCWPIRAQLSKVLGVEIKNICTDVGERPLDKVEANAILDLLPEAEPHADLLIRLFFNCKESFEAYGLTHAFDRTVEPMTQWMIAEILSRMKYEGVEDWLAEKLLVRELPTTNCGALLRAAFYNLPCELAVGAARRWFDLFPMQSTKILRRYDCADNQEFLDSKMESKVWRSIIENNIMQGVRRQEFSHHFVFHHSAEQIGRVEAAINSRVPLSK